jgi:hypothetical protein
MEEEKEIKTNGKWKRQRNLPQYRALDDDAFEEIMLRKEADIAPSQEFERRIELKLKKFEVDYDLSDLKINDLEALRALIQALISLEDYEQLLYKIRQDGLNVDNIVKIDKVNKVMSDLRSDISKLQDDLKITRKIRKSDQETSLIDYIEKLTEKAKKFHESREAYIFCPKCNMLLCTAWFLYPDLKSNKIELVCKRTLDNGEPCNTVIRVTSKDLFENRGTNKKEVLPESMR